MSGSSARPLEPWGAHPESIFSKQLWNDSWLRSVSRSVNWMQLSHSVKTRSLELLSLQQESTMKTHFLDRALFGVRKCTEKIFSDFQFKSSVVYDQNYRFDIFCFYNTPICRLWKAKEAVGPGTVEFSILDRVYGPDSEKKSNRVLKLTIVRTQILSLPGVNIMYVPNRSEWFAEFSWWNYFSSWPWKTEI